MMKREYRDDNWDGNKKLSYDDFMYILDLCSIDFHMQQQEPIASDEKLGYLRGREDDVFDMCKYFVAMMRYMFGNLDEDWKKRKRHLEVEVFENDFLTKNFTDAIESVILQARDWIEENWIDDYLRLIHWPFIRLINLRNRVTYADEQRQMMYCNMVALRTSQFITLNIDNKSDLFFFVDHLLKEMAQLSSEISDDQLNKFIQSYMQERCVAVTSVKRKNGYLEWYLAFSGFRDNNKICREFKIKGCEEEFSKILCRALINNKLKNIDLSKMKYCKLDYCIESYEICSPHAAPTRLSSFRGITNRNLCMKKHYSCCERKILPNILNRSTIDKVHFYTTFQPCRDCLQALSQMENAYKKGMVLVSARKTYVEKEHPCGRRKS